MGTIELHHEITIAAPAAVAWAVVADYRRDVDWRTGVLSMIPTPDDLVNVGTTTVERIRAGGRTYVNDGEVTAVDPGVRFEWRTTAGVTAHGARAVRVLDEERCRVRLELTVAPEGFNRAIAPLLRRMLASNLHRDLDRLQSIVEAGMDRSARPLEQP